MPFLLTFEASSSEFQTGILFINQAVTENYYGNCVPCEYCWYGNEQWSWGRIYTI